MGLLLSFSSSFSSLSQMLPRFRSDPKPKPKPPSTIIEMRKKNRTRLVKLVSSAGTGFFYIAKKTKKSRRKFGGDKLEIRKFDPRVRHHVLFTEQKIK